MTLIVVAISSPIILGVYKNKKLIEEYSSDDKTSEALPILFFKAYNKYKLQKLLYTNGPGSFTSVKLAYIFLKSISIIKDLEFFSADSFNFCNNRPIKAIGKSYFIKNMDKIEIKKLDKPPEETNFYLPKQIEFLKFSIDTKPLYLLSSV